MPGDVSVYVRIRPPLAGEPREAAATVLNKETVRLEVARTATVCEHGCDAAFGPHASQAELFDGVARDVVDAVLAGVDGTVVAYGQTGAGKSHTLGVLEAPDHVERARDGVVPRALRRLFAARPGEVVMSFLEIYDERVRDLLAPPRDAAEVERRRHDEAFSAKAPRPADIVEGLPVRENTRGGFEVEGLRAYAARDLAEALDLVAYGLRRRATAATKLNATSSRSHTILVVDAGGAALRVVDLAGSERNRVSGSRGVRLREARAINASLAALGNVVAALADGAAHVPFRDSVLTKLLRDALGAPGARTALVAALAPGRAAAAESASTLRFASRCARVRLRAVRRLDLAPDEQLERARGASASSRRRRRRRPPRGPRRDGLRRRGGRAGGGGRRRRRGRPRRPPWRAPAGGPTRGAPRPPCGPRPCRRSRRSPPRAPRRTRGPRSSSTSWTRTRRSGSGSARKTTTTTPTTTTSGSTRSSTTSPACLLM